MNDAPAKRNDDVQLPETNHFKELLPEAKDELRRIMKTSPDAKLRASVAKDIVELAGAGVATPPPRQIIINDSQIQLLVQVAREAFGAGGSS